MGFPQEGRECQGTPLQPSRKILGGEYPQLRLGRPWLGWERLDHERMNGLDSPEGTTRRAACGAARLSNEGTY